MTPPHITGDGHPWGKPAFTPPDRPCLHLTGRYQHQHNKHHQHHHAHKNHQHLMQ